MRDYETCNNTKKLILIIFILNFLNYKQIYTLTVLNGTEPWLRIDNTPDQSTTPALDFDTMLGNSFPGYIKSEYTYDESGFIVPVDNKDDIIVHQQLLQQQQQQQQQLSTTAAVTNSISSTNMTFQNNNNDWQMVDHNSIEQVKK